ncbi:MAG: hypothetical protein H5T36_01235 [Methanobacteriaceae archaeon]|uniref:Uncharacterized protein n=1 Tax=Methanothermobacter thermautotrophicus TaxID=145262 RepID=A0A7J4MXA0_METTF|nr:hypothetical protein [Methanobacteriaceae archaeon]HIH65379.1 hypothetical protein [Methanothermobacter thermautotrophicus]
MWKEINVVFKLKSPLHIGYLPFRGSVVSPTRYYVPGRNLWGAVTKRTTENLLENPAANDYKNIGKEIMENFMFSYFYIYDEKTIYFPQYTNEGLKYGYNKKITRSEFEHKFIGSQISTAIDLDSLTAKDESLHEIEFISNKFQESGNLKDVKITGWIWIKEDAKINNREVDVDAGIFIDNFNIIQELILGGESKYGFGHVLLDGINKIDPPFEVEIKDSVTVSSEFLISHLKYDKNLNFMGDLELLAGRGYFDPETQRGGSGPGATISKPQYYFTPGTKLEDKTYFQMRWDGKLMRLSA